jgi:tetratricopeptide (TPR) repeat protein
MFAGLPRRETSLRTTSTCSPASLVVRLMGLALVLTITAACNSANPADVKADAIRRGDDLVGKKHYAEAVSAYQIAVKSDPKDAELRLKLAAAHRLANQLVEAIREAIIAADLQPGNPEVQMLAAGGLIMEGQFVDASDRISRVLKSDPDNAGALVLFANANAQLVTVTWALVKLEEAMRLGLDVEAARLHLRPGTAQFDDRTAEGAFRRALQIAPKMPEARLGFASFLWAAGRLDEGADVMKQAADDDPGHAFLSRALGLFYASRGRDTEAEKYLNGAASTGDRDSQLVLADYYGRRNRSEETLPMLDKMAAGDDPDGGAALRAADIEFRLGRRDQAMQRAEKVLARDPRNARALRIKAQALLAAKDVSQATKIAGAAVAAEPGSRDARLVLARSLAATGDLDRAFHEFAEAWRLGSRDAEVAKALTGLALTLGRAEVALEYAREGVRLRPNDRDASIALVRALIRNGDFPGADRTLAPLLAMRTASPDVLVLLAAIQAARGRNDAARSTYLTALQADRDSLEALSGLVGLEIQDHQVARVQQRVEQAVSAHPKDPGYLLLAVRTSRAAGDAKRPESMLRTILDIDPGHVEAVLLLGDVLAHQSRREEATQLIQRALTRLPSSFELQVALANLLEETGHVTEARTRYEAIIAGNKSAVAVSVRLAALYANQRDNLDRALELAATAKQRLPNDPSVSDTLGWVYVRKDLPSLGTRYLEDAVRAEPATALFRYHLGIAHERQGQFQAARDELTRALTLDPNFPGAADARAALQTLAKLP